MAKENVLHRVRTALGRGAGQAPEPAPPARIRVPEIEVEARVASFRARIEALAGKTYRVASAAEARTVVCGILNGRGAVASNAPFLEECGVTGIDGVCAGFHAREELRAACAGAGAGITSADYALGDTGSLVMLSSPREARLVSLLPPAHIAVLPRERILTGLDELFTILPRPADETSSLVLITGPSRTADIEQILVRGVHGPGEFHVVVVG